MRNHETSSHTILSLLAGGRYSWLLLLTLLLSGCDQYNTDVLGTAFQPTNSLVSSFVHPVYVDYREGGVRVWGPYADAVTAQIEGARLSLTSQDDSLAIIVYGNAVGDSLHHVNGQLKVTMERDFALYLNGLKLHSDQGPAIEIQAEEHICYLVLGKNKTNILSDSLYATQYHDGLAQEPNGCLYVYGQLYLDGTGSLTLHNVAEPYISSRTGDSVYTHALYARDGMVCNYAVTSQLTSRYGDAIHSLGAEVRIVKGKWNLYPARYAIQTEGAIFSLGEDAKVYVNDSLFVFTEEQ